MEHATCESCGGPSPRRGPGRAPRFCDACVHGTDCGRDWHRRTGVPMCEPCRDAWNAVSAKRSSAARSAGWRRGPRTTYSRICAWCETEFQCEERKQRYCSLRCYGRACRKVPCTDLVVRVQVTRDAPPTPTTIVTMPKWWAVLVAGPCAWCGTNFVGVGGSTLYCSKRCQRQRSKSARGKEFQISPIVRRAIYERDAWTCQLCNGTVDRNADPLSDWFPSLDHIEPQSHALIPDHSPANLRTAHRWCNAVRGDGTYHADLFEEAS